ncbi:hypothetical protein BN1723_013378 [Verticillium longisporum]|uniref:Rhodopsin domain-containing protein n=3 Tax=Verticillium longisporum TaxID=100787 RepID=A0A0G4LRT4_VERLO|nr:hypothetical protein BN1723_013378 [Verticillium longisporum]
MMDAANPVDPNLRSLTPVHLPLAIIVVSSIFLFLSIIAVGLRTYVRITDRVFGLDDGLMAAGAVIYTAVVGLAIYACTVGIGTRQEKLNAWMAEEAMKFYIIWILTYVWALAIVKSSICVTIQRIADTQRIMRISVWILLAITWASFLVTFVGVLLYCRPVEAVWQPALILSGEAKCAPVETFIALGHVATSTTIVTDLALAVLPAVMLWKSQMKTQTKLQVFGLLSFASLASIITMVRIPYVNRFRVPVDLQFWVGHTVLCSNIETGIGCVASSIPSLRRLIMRRRGLEDSTQHSGRATAGDVSLFTFGNSKKTPGASRDRFRNPTDVGFSLTTVQGLGDDNWERLQDGDSDKGDLLSADREGAKGIRAHYTYAVEYDQSPPSLGQGLR